MIECPDPGALVEAEIDRVLTQYRESPKLLHLIRTYLLQAEEALRVICSIPDFFDIDTSVGDQLTLIGKRLGWPRCHCYCVTQPVFGFACEGVPSEYTLTGFCDDSGTWVDCADFGVETVCITDDSVYRQFLYSRRYQFLGLYDIASLEAAVRHLFGPTGLVLDAGQRRVVIAPGRPLSADESALLPLYQRVLPVALGISIRFHLGALPVFGFGDGWGGFCEGAEWMCPEEITCAVPDVGVPAIPVHLDLWPEIYSEAVPGALVEYDIEPA